MVATAGLELTHDVIGNAEEVAASKRKGASPKNFVGIGSGSKVITWFNLFTVYTNVLVSLP
ncbi:hypothetical protein D3C87_1028210 [compost metagenome]